MSHVYLLAISANISFAIGSLIFTVYTRRFHARWMNFFKALIALFVFGIAFIMSFEAQKFHLSQFGFLFLSGFIGLGIGDIFLLQAFKDFGAGRTLMVFGFQPVIIGFLSYFLFNQAVSFSQVLAIAVFILCLLTIGHENFQKNKSWQLSALGAALAGVVLDALGVIITRYAFDLSPALTSMEGNFFRCLGAITAFIFIRLKYQLDFVKFNKMLTKKDWVIVSFGSIMGTFVSLALYLRAIQIGHLASISGIAITGSLFCGIVECLYAKKLPSVHLLGAFMLFLVGAFFLF